MNEPLEPRLAQLLRRERDRPDPASSTQERVLERVQATVAAPAPGSTSNTPPARGSGFFARGALLSIAAAGAVGSLMALRGMPPATPRVESVTRGAAIARESTQDRATLAQIAMAAIMHDVARPRAIALAGAAGGPMPGMSGPTTLSEDQEDRLPAGAAAVLTALGRVNEPTITRTVLAFEALWLRRQSWLGAVYWGARPPTLHAIRRLRKKKMPAKIAVMRDSTLAWPRTENSASVRPMPRPPPSLR